MNADEIYKLRQEGFNEGIQHNFPSPETIRQINELKVNFARMEEKIDNIIDIIKEIKDGKADKWVEDAMKWLITSTIALDFVVIGTLISWWLSKH